jgi:hypothetical protein
LSVWWDRDIGAGSDFRAVIEQQINDARCMVVVWSTNANASKWVRDEADEGARRGMLVPVLIDRVLPPMGFRGMQAADLTGWQGEREAAAITQLLADIAPVLKKDRAAGQAADAAIPPAGTRPIRGSWRNTFNPRWLLGVVPLVLVAAWWLSMPPASKPSGAAATSTVAADRVSPEPAAAAGPLPPLVPAEPPPADYFVMPAVGKQPDSGLRLAKTHEKRNQITDDADWWVANALPRLAYTVPNPFRQEVGDLPPFVPTEFQTLRVVKAIRGTPVVAIYGANFSEGRYLLAIDPATGRGLFSFDFSLYEWPRSFARPEKEFVQMATTWAQVEGNILYVAHAHRTYAKSSDGFNAYISAIDVAANRIVWRSQPLVSNADNFVIKGDAVITGYGFTNEKDMLYVLNKADGRVVQQVPLKSGPSTLAMKDNVLHVRTYDTDYVFQFGAPLSLGR